MSELACPAKIYDEYTCQVTGADGVQHYYDDLLFEGQVVSIRGDHSEDAPYGRVVRKDDGLWIEALTADEEHERSEKQLADLKEPNGG